MKKEILYWSLVIVSCLFMTFQASAAKAECTLVVDKKCFVEPAPFDCSSAKPINSITVIWYGLQEPVYVKAWNGSVDTGTPQTFGPISLGDEVTFTRSGEFPNDIDWEIYSDDGFANKIGESTFHLSCSDEDMNGPEDCGKLAGDGKAVPGYQNWWTFEGMAGNGLVLDCTPAPVAGADACSFEAPPPPSCETSDKPTSLTLRYTGGGCAESDNNQDPSKAVCTATPSGGIVTGDIEVRAAGNQYFSDYIYTVDPTTVPPGGEFTITFGGNDLKADSYVEIVDDTGVTELNRIHTSCSQPLAAGDVFGSLTVVGINGLRPDSEVTYFYEVTNTGATSVDVTSVFDDKLGELLESPETLTPGESFTLTKTAFISETTENTVTVNGQPGGSTSTCTATDSVTVTVGPPTLTIDIKPGDEDNCINNNGHGVIPVAILGSADFDVTQVDPSTCSLAGQAVRVVGKSDKLLAHIEDVNGDGFDDLVLQIEDVDGTFQAEVGEATLSCYLYDGTSIEGTDSICIVP